MKRIKKTKELDQQYVERINKELYKRNIELAIKNKTLSLLRKLYDITISSVVSLKDLASRLAIEIRQDLNFEMVGTYLLKEDNKELESLAVVKSERFSEALKKEKITSILNAIKLKKHKKNICNLAINEQKKELAKSLIEIWPDKKLSRAFFTLQKKLLIKDILVYPLLIEEKVLGIFLIVLNREYDSLSTFEKETIESFIDVIAVALDKTMAYEQLRKMNKQLEDLMAKLSKAYGVEKKSRKELQRIDEAKNQFIMASQHHLRTPLTSMKGYMDLILSGVYGKIPLKTKEAISKLQTSANRLIKIINELLDISQFQLGKKVVSLKPNIEIEPILKEIVEELQLTAQTKGIYLKLEKPAEKLPTVEADLEKLKIALFNIFDNAIKYTIQGGVTIKVQVLDKKLRIISQDTGIGISQENMKSLFTGIFERGEEAKKVFTTGKGIGLYIASQIIQAHNGKIWAESEGPGKGSTFFIELPIG